MLIPLEKGQLVSIETSARLENPNTDAVILPNSLGLYNAKNAKQATTCKDSAITARLPEVTMARRLALVPK